jgi:hypothetical protein
VRVGGPGSWGGSRTSILAPGSCSASTVISRSFRRTCAGSGPISVPSEPVRWDEYACHNADFKLILTGDEKGFDPAQHVPQMLA